MGEGEQPLVLLAHERREALETFAGVLAASGVRVVDAATVGDVLDRAMLHRPEVVVLSLALEGGEPLLAARAILASEANSNARIIALADALAPASRAGAIRAGCDVFLLQPVGPAALAHEVLRAAGMLSPPPTASLRITARRRRHDG
jgi:CheY-like chemotaxis protein